MLKYKLTFIHREGFMRLLFSFVFLFFLSFQAQAQSLIEYPIHLNMDEFDWEAFTNKENIQKHIDRRNRRFKIHGAKIITIDLSKKDLVQIEQELELYKRGIKTGLSSEIIQLAEEAIALHRENVNSIENKINAYAGLGGSIDVLVMEQINGTKPEFYKETWELSEAEHEIVFNMVNIEDKRLYEALGSNDEDYAEFIIPYVKRLLKKIQNTTEAYYNSLGGELDYEIPLGRGYLYRETTFKSFNADNLIDMYSNSLEIYNSFVKNFENRPIGSHQKELMRVIEDWYVHQAFLAVDGWINSYKIYGIYLRPLAVIRQLRNFYEAPMEIKKMIALFLRNDILNNEELMREYLFSLDARIDALEILHSLGLATTEETELYNVAKEQERQEIQELIKKSKEQNAKKQNAKKQNAKKQNAKEQNVIKKKDTNSGSGLSFLDTAS